MAADVAVAVIQAGTPESMGSVMDKWLDEHHEAEVLSMEMQVVPSGQIFLLVVYRRERRARKS